MKILVPGNLVEAITCSDCKAVFEFDRKKDVKTESDGEYSYTTVKCPYCDYNVSYDQKNVKETAKKVEELRLQELSKKPPCQRCARCSCHDSET